MIAGGERGSPWGRGGGGVRLFSRCAPRLGEEQEEDRDRGDDDRDEELFNLHISVLFFIAENGLSCSQCV